MSTGNAPLLPNLPRKRPLHLTINSASQPHHHRWIRPPPRSPYPWIWFCHKCLIEYRFSAALNRCLSCSHHFCRKCISEYDYDGWDEWKAYWAPSSPSPVSNKVLNTKAHLDENDNDMEEDEDWDAEWLACSPSSASSDSGDCSNDKEYCTHDAFYSETNDEWYRRKTQEIKDAFGQCNTEAKFLREAEKKHLRSCSAEFLAHEVHDDDNADSPVFSPDIDSTDRQIFASAPLNRRPVRPLLPHLHVPPITAPVKENYPPSQQRILHIDSLMSPEESVLSPLGYQHLVPLISEGAVGGYEPGEEMVRLVTPAAPYFGDPIMVGQRQQPETEEEESDDWRKAVDEVIGGSDNEEESPEEDDLHLRRFQ
ncbi:hypothetical protein EDC01DRAFT_630455 [Geopyxis carbonaria]|nr:hypothetical protein EDC01DRAFT_630455 [Geopyxis carbonaria]